MRYKFVPCGSYPEFVANTYKYYSVEHVMEDGRAVTRSVVISDVVADRDKGVTVNDFALENLLANGVDLKDAIMSDDLFMSHDKVVTFLESQNVKENG